MGFKCGIVGLPNVGKSTLFNALTETAAAQAANYPFCTIEPNVGEVAVPDPRLDVLAKLAQVGRDHADAAHLRRHRRPGAAAPRKARGSATSFSRNIREVDAIAHVVRCFEDADVTHVDGRDRSGRRHRDHRDRADARRSRQPRAARRRAGEEGARRQDKEAKETLDLVNRALALLREGKPARLVERKPEEEKLFHTLGLLTSMPVLYVCNVDEASAATGNEFSRAGRSSAPSEEGAACVVISAKIEAEIAVLPRDERDDFLGAIGLKEPGLDRLIRAGYGLLDLVTYFTAGPKEARAWTITRGTKAPQAAGVIHSDFERGFIRAETIAYDDYVTLRRRGRRARRRQDAAGRQGLRRRRRRRDAFPVCDLMLCAHDLVSAPVPTFADDACLHPAAVADRAEVLVDAEHDQDEFGDDAGEQDADQHADEARERHEHAARSG